MIIAVTGQCGEWPTACAVAERTARPLQSTELRGHDDGRHAGERPTGGFAELIVAWEEMTVPIFSKARRGALEPVLRR